VVRPPIPPPMIMTFTTHALHTTGRIFKAHYRPAAGWARNRFAVTWLMAICTNETRAFVLTVIREVYARRRQPIADSHAAGTLAAPRRAVHLSPARPNAERAEARFRRLAWLEK
jgi:hypothetical protein